MLVQCTRRKSERSEAMAGGHETMVSETGVAGYSRSELASLAARLARVRSWGGLYASVELSPMVRSALGVESGLQGTETY